jgi:hypothetical protein
MFGASFGFEDVILALMIIGTGMVLYAFVIFLGIVAAWKFIRRNGPVTIDEIRKDEEFDDIMRRRAVAAEKEHRERLRAGARADLAEPDPYVDGR